MLQKSNSVGLDRKRNRSFNIPRVCSNNETLLHLRQTQKQRSETKQVSFAKGDPKEENYESYIEERMTEDEKLIRKNQIWYSRSDLEEFLQERVASVRILKSVGGDVFRLKAQHPSVCIRGLEAYQYSGLSNTIQNQRELHQNAVFDEQLRQKEEGVKDVEKIRSLACLRSQWARNRAQQLATLDALEAREHHFDMNGQMSGMRQRGAPERRSLPSPSRSGGLSLALLASALPSRQRNPVDVAVLKDLNAQFLRQICSSSNGRVSTSFRIRRDSLGAQALNHSTPVPMNSLSAHRLSSNLNSRSSQTSHHLNQNLNTRSQL